MSDKLKPGWQSAVTSLREGIRILYNTKELSDVKFIINKGSHEFPAHKFVLSARSNEFKRLLLDADVVPNPLFIEKENITKRGFEILLRFCYTDEIGTEEKLPITEAYIAADYYQQTALKNVCETKIAGWSIDVNEVWNLLNAGLEVDLLKRRCLECIENNTEEALSEDSFKNISCDCIKAVLDSGVLNNVPTLDRLQKVLEWAVPYYSIDPNATSKFSPLREIFLQNELLGKLGLETLDPSDVADVIVNYDGLITPQESMQFLRYSKQKDIACLPKWCVPAV